MDIGYSLQIIASFRLEKHHDKFSDKLQSTVEQIKTAPPTQLHTLPKLWHATKAESFETMYTERTLPPEINID